MKRRIAISAAMVAVYALVPVAAFFEGLLM